MTEFKETAIVVERSKVQPLRECVGVVFEVDDKGDVTNLTYRHALL